MASGGERIATTTAVEKGLDKVIVTCIVDGLLLNLFRKTVKDAAVTIRIEDWGFDMTAVLRDSQTTFRKVVKKLPGQVIVDQCTWKATKGKVEITLMKAKKESWAVQLSQGGLEQYQSDEEDD